MSELDKYFEKARNVEPIYEEDDARKLLYGKLSDGGIATNLYNKIKVFPMITALITSVATIATIAFFSMSSPNAVVEQPNTQKHKTVSSVNSTTETDELKEKKIITRSIIANYNTIDEKETAKTKEKAESKTWTDDNKIDIKSVNSLKLTKDELAQLGIVIDDKSFKINAFDKYTYTINQNNEKQRDYYDTEKDRDALPTPAMVTTSTGFKTLTLFKKGNVEATVDRYKSSSNSEPEYTTNVEQIFKTDDADIDIKVNKVENDSRELSSNSNMDYVVDGDTVKVEYKKKTDTSERSLTIKFPEGYEDIKDLDSHKERLDGLINSFDDKGVATAFRKTDPNKRKDTVLARIDLGYVNSEFFDKSFDVVEQLVNALTINPDISYILNNINRIRSINIMYQDYKVACDFQQILKKDSHKFDFSKYNFRQMFDKKLDSSKFDNPNYYKTFQVSWWGYPDFFDEKLSVPNKNDNGIKILEGTVTTFEDLFDLSNSNYTVRDLMQRKSDSLEVIRISNDDINVEKNSKSVYKSVDVSKQYDISSKFENAPYYDLKKGIEYYKKLLIGNKDSSEIIKEIQKPKTFNYDFEGVSFEFKTSEISTIAKINDKTNLVTTELKINRNKDKKPQSLVVESFDYNINELIPIEVSFDGVNTDFIVWYEATDNFLSKLPSKIKAKINPELMALTEQMDHCENEPIEKKETVMDVWSGCSGAIKEMKVFPNPTTSNSNVEFELQDNRVISIAIFDLSGKLIKNVKSGMSIGKGNTKELLNLTGINPGLYYVVVKSEKGEQALQRIIIE